MVVFIFHYVLTQASLWSFNVKDFMFPGTGFHAQLNRLGKNLVFKHPFLYDTSLKKGIQESTKAPRHQEIISNFWKFRLRSSKHFLKIKK